MKAAPTPRRQQLLSALRSPRLPVTVALVGVLLASPALFSGWHLDDHVHRYLLGEYPGARELARAYVSPFAIADGDPAHNRWLVEEGYAPWWMHEELRLTFFRPLAELTHRFDHALFPGSALLQHAHSLAWFGAVLVAAGAAFRALLGPGGAAGLAALIYAVDPTHALPAGWIANRNALPAVLLGLVAIRAHARAAAGEGPRWAGPVAFAAGLLAGEVTLGALGYVLAHALTLDPRPRRARALALAPYAAVFVAWRLAYAALGHGAVGSGLYLDPVAEPARFLAALPLRLPLLLLGAVAAPPPEAYFFAPAALRPAIVGLAVAVGLAFVTAVTPLLRARARARCLALGVALCLPLAATAYPHGRLLFFVGFGVAALLAELVSAAMRRAAYLPRALPWHLVAQPLLVYALGAHLLAGPLLLPVGALSVAATGSITERAIPDALATLRSREQELFVVSAPDYFYVTLLPIVERLAGRSPPGRLRMLSVGPVSLRILRVGARALELEYEGGLISTPFSELYRGRGFPMTPGTRRELRGATIELVEVTDDGRPRRARVTFDAPLEDPRYAFVVWEGGTFRAFVPPAPGAELRVPPARLPFGMPDG